MIRVQIVTAMAQLGLVPDDSPLWNEVYKVLKKVAIRVGHGVGQEDAVQTTIIRLLRNWSFAEDWRAFETYIRKTLRYACRETDQQPKILPNQESFTVREAGAFLRLSCWYVYDLIREGTVRTVPNSKPLHINRGELERISPTLIRGSERLAYQCVLESRGKSREAARKATYRRFGRKPKLSDLRPS